MVSPSCLGTALAVCLRFRGVVGCGVLCLGSAGRIDGTSVVGVSVFAQVRLGGAWAGMYMRHMVFARYFVGVAVAFKPF